jgi:O-antigen/teichoic acid export membrane protein
MFFSAPFVAGFYAKTELVSIVRFLSATLFFQSLRSVSTSRAMRSFQFSKLTIRDSLCSIAAASVAVLMAANGMGVWSLVTNLLLGSFLSTCVTLLLVPPVVKLQFDWQVLRRVLRWGLPQTGSGLLWKFYDNADYLIIGKVLGSGPLGIYTIAFRLATLVNEKVSGMVTGVSFTTFSALKGKPEAAEHWISLTRKLAAINFGLLALLFMMGEDAVLVILGEKWLSAVLPMRILCFVGAIKTLSSVTSSVLAASGRTGLVFVVNLANTIVFPVSFLVAAKVGGIVGVAIAWSVLLPFSLGYLLHTATKAIGIRLSYYLTSLKVPVIVLVATVAASGPTLLLMPRGISRLVAGSVLGCICGGFTLLLDPFFRRQAQRVGTWFTAGF